MLQIKTRDQTFTFTFQDGGLNDRHQYQHSDYNSMSKLIVSKNPQVTPRYVICSIVGGKECYMHNNGFFQIQYSKAEYTDKIFDVISLNELITTMKKEMNLEEFAIPDEKFLQSQINNYHKDKLVQALHDAYHKGDDDKVAAHDSFMAEMKQFTCNHQIIEKKDLESLYKCMDKFYQSVNNGTSHNGKKHLIEGDKGFIELIAHILSYLNPYSYLTDKPRSDLAAKRTFQEIVKTQSEQSVAIIL